MAEPIITKRCSKCKLEKNVSEFYRDKSSNDGRFCWCKQCHDKNNKKYQHTERFKAKRARITKTYRKNHTQKYKATTILYHAIERKGFPKASTYKCIYNCGAQAEQYHHPDYSKALNVIPVCDKCHKSIHNH